MLLSFWAIVTTILYERFGQFLDPQSYTNKYRSYTWISQFMIISSAVNCSSDYFLQVAPVLPTWLKMAPGNFFRRVKVCDKPVEKRKK